MLSVIIEARTEGERLPALLAQLTAGAVDGLIRQVLIVAEAGEARVAALCEETGADPHPTIEAAAAAARADWLVVLPADFRLRDGWIGALEHQLARGGEALVTGLSETGLFARRPYGVLVERRRLEGRRGADLQRLRRELGLSPRRVG